MKFQDTSLSIQEVEGVETLKFHLGMIKNMHGTLAKVGRESNIESILPRAKWLMHLLQPVFIQENGLIVRFHNKKNDKRACQKCDMRTTIA